MTFPWWFAAVLVATLCVFGGAPSWAGEAPPPPNTGALSLTVVLNVPTSYYFRGIAQSNAGFQLQPFLELKANLYEGERRTF